MFWVSYVTTMKTDWNEHGNNSEQNKTVADEMNDA